MFILRKFCYKDGGYAEKQQVILNKDIRELGTTVLYKNTVFNMLFFDQSKNPVPVYYAEVEGEAPQIEEYITDETLICECGAEKVGHPGHSGFCPKFICF